MATQVALRLESKLRAGKPLAFARCCCYTTRTHATPPQPTAEASPRPSHALTPTSTALSSSQQPERRLTACALLTPSYSTSLYAHRRVDLSRFVASVLAAACAPAAPLTCCGAASLATCCGAAHAAELVTGEGEGAVLAAEVQRSLVSEASLGFVAFLLSTRHAALHREGCAALLASTWPFEAQPCLEARPFEAPVDAMLSETGSGGGVEQPCATPNKAVEAAAENDAGNELLPDGALTLTWPGHALEVAVDGEAVGLSTLLRRLVAAGSLSADECAPMLAVVCGVYSSPHRLRRTLHA